MITDLRNSIIFLHGLSGSGKGEAQRQLVEKFKPNGYEVIYGSSGDLLRASFSIPFIRERLLKGYYFDTLEPIMPGLENIFKDFICKWVESHGKTILILDGVIRRSDFVNSEGKKIPSQVEQIARGVNNVINTLSQGNPSIRKAFPEYRYDLDEASQVKKIEDLLKGSTHIVVDIRPQDAENQMKTRAIREIASIKSQLEEMRISKITSDDIITEIQRQTEVIEAIVQNQTIVNRESIIYNRDVASDDVEKASSNIDMNIKLNEVKSQMAQMAGIEGESTTLASIYGKFKIKTAIREDDITVNGRKNRIKNFVNEKIEGTTTTHEPGFAAIALSRDLGFRLTDDVTFQSTLPNLHVVENGQSRGVTLAEFKNRASSLAEHLYVQIEKERTVMVEGAEGKRHGQER
ncbi:MAG: hypothetical protein AAB662_04685 [Patescibacteria group bacterium]